ncbi:hypothetical protein RO21_03160 [[Actinobacillus] muris]|uniref:Uncharacterized protein n=1 Tax=Muribacter muris TaxID=67855 RepID=A0A0J5S5B1_9PAST|nr:hypothetical protein [Muribacter muris]KMK52012.1 hypothetical protein RO21_03160 [[Actinobacillus] muris] [Muribacter muris]
MWQQQTLQHSPQAREALEANLRGEQSPFDVSLTGLKIGVHNWSHGLETKSGRYLSPENANKAFIAKMTDYADPNRPSGELDVVVIMVTAANIEQFIAQMENVMILLPEPAFKQAYDYAKAHQKLAETKMVKTPQIASPAFGQENDITPQSGRDLQGIMRGSLVANVASGDPFAVIDELIQQKARRQAENKQKIERILHTSAQVYAFQDRGVLDVIALNLQKNVPSANNVFTATVCFIGKDLSNLRGMLNGNRS